MLAMTALAALALPAAAQAQTILECRLDGKAEPSYVRIDPATSAWDYFSRKTWSWKPTPCTAASAALEGLSRCAVTVTDEQYRYENKASDRSSVGLSSESDLITIDRESGRYSSHFVARRELYGSPPSVEEERVSGSCVRASVDPATRPKPAPKL